MCNSTKGNIEFGVESSGIFFLRRIPLSKIEAFQSRLSEYQVDFYRVRSYSSRAEYEKNSCRINFHIIDSILQEKLSRAYGFREIPKSKTIASGSAEYIDQRQSRLATIREVADFCIEDGSKVFAVCCKTRVSQSKLNSVKAYSSRTIVKGEHLCFELDGISPAMGRMNGLFQDQDQNNIDISESSREKVEEIKLFLRDYLHEESQVQPVFRW